MEFGLFGINPKKSQEFFARKADGLQNTVKQYVKYKIYRKPKNKNFALIGVNPDVINLRNNCFSN